MLNIHCHSPCKLVFEYIRGFLFPVLLRRTFVETSRGYKNWHLPGGGELWFPWRVLFKATVVVQFGVATHLKNRHGSGPEQYNYSFSDNDFEKATGRRSYRRISPTDNALKLIIWKNIKAYHPAKPSSTIQVTSVYAGYPTRMAKFKYSTNGKRATANGQRMLLKTLERHV